MTSDAEKIEKLEQRVAVLEAMVARLNREAKPPAIGQPIKPLGGTFLMGRTSP